jgi:predicted  nucleic acid-binding Zn-ribbon protein
MSVDPYANPPKVSTSGAIAGNKLRSTGDRFWFFGTLLMGVLFLIFTKDLADQLLLVTLGAGGLLLPYCLYSMRRAEKTGEHDRFADSCYYLGFLLTLIGLTVSLYALGQAENKQAAGVLARFGAALTTTLVGMVFRILIVQFRPGAASTTGQAEASIGKSMLHVAQELEVSVKLFEDIRRNAVNSIEQATKGAETGLRTAAETQIKVIENFSKNVFDSHGQNLESLDEVLGGIGTQMSRLQDVLSNIGDAGEATEQRWVGLKGRLDIIADSLDDMSESARQFVTTGESLSKTGTELEKVTGALGSTSKAVENLSKVLSGSEAVVQRMKADIEANLNDVQALRRMINEEHGAAAQVTDELYKKLASTLDLINSRLAAAGAYEDQFND